MHSYPALHIVKGQVCLHLLLGLAVNEEETRIVLAMKNLTIYHTNYLSAAAALLVHCLPAGSYFLQHRAAANCQQRPAGAPQHTTHNSVFNIQHSVFIRKWGQKLRQPGWGAPSGNTPGWLGGSGSAGTHVACRSPPVWHMCVLSGCVWVACNHLKCVVHREFVLVDTGQ